MEVNPSPFSKKTRLSLGNNKSLGKNNFSSGKNLEKWCGVKKAVVPIAGLATRFLPLSKVLPKELWPLVDKPMIQYTLEELKASKVFEVIFVISPEKKPVLAYFKKDEKIKRILKERKKTGFLTEIKKLEEICQGMKFSFVFQKKPLGDGHAVLQAEKKMKGEPCLVLYPDDIVKSKIPCAKKLIQIFKKYKRPVMAVSKIERRKIPFYGIIGGKKIEMRIYKVEKILEKPSIEMAPSNLAIIGKRIITPEVFYYLKKVKFRKRGEIGLTETLAQMVKNKKEILAHEIDGEWLECGNKNLWLKSNFYLSIKDPLYGKELKRFIKEKKLL